MWDALNVVMLWSYPKETGTIAQVVVLVLVVVKKRSKVVQEPEVTGSSKNTLAKSFQEEEQVPVHIQLCLQDPVMKSLDQKLNKISER